MQALADVISLDLLNEDCEPGIDLTQDDKYADYVQFFASDEKKDPFPHIIVNSLMLTSPEEWASFVKLCESTFQIQMQKLVYL